ncbi:DUF885 domain-containing protein [Natronosporangium hydrolyticum]|uniref:DUF885 domain-containing protein n=1 Tax=Natronosporangium hydrolyticum TaxID=2811111 RepID=A0A895YDJ6_9ACTN|nr:DUF885 domain-containing protein [Natronosporangium hydrolyticum]QSB13459.1 DUF885 domain-containing protein [Natronosporangium hydrolyticum]
MPSPIFQLCDQHVQRSCALDPVAATFRGVAGEIAAETDYRPEGYAARADQARDTLRQLGQLSPADSADRVAADHLRERLEAEVAWHDSGEPLRLLRAPFGMLQTLRTSIDLMPRDSEEQWRAVAARLDAMPRMLAGWRESLAAGASQGLLAARRQAVAAAAQAERYADTKTFDSVVAGYGDGPCHAELAAGARAAHAGFAETAAWLRQEYAPRAGATDAVGPERYAINSRLSLGADIDLREAYEWAWQELHRLEAELAAEAQRVRPGATIAEAIAHLDATEFVVGLDAYRGWLQERHDQAIAALDGVHFDIAAPLRRVEVVTQENSAAGSASYTPPSEDLSRPGRTWWPVAGRERFGVWAELTTVFHEGVPGHHLQLGHVLVAAAGLSRFARVSRVSAHSEGWALYAERLADELGWYATPGQRLGMLKASALRAARVVIDIGLHLDLPLPPAEAKRHGDRWSFETATEVLRDRGRIAPHRLHPEVVRYCGWPGQASSYKLGERAWLAARAEARSRLGGAFDLKRWHTQALALGPVGLATLTDALRAASD